MILNRATTSPFACAVWLIILIYLVPALGGFPFWPGSDHASRLVVHTWTADTTTFDLGYRPIRAFIAHELAQGYLPLWIPTQMLGVPLIEQYEYQLLNPLEWLNWVGTDTWWSFVLCGYLIIAAAGIMRISTWLGVDEWAAMGGAIAYVGAGFTTWFYTTASFITAIPVIPWLLYFTARLFAEPRTLLFGSNNSGTSIVGFWLSCLALLLVGQPQIIFVTIYFVAIFALVLSVRTFRDGYRWSEILRPWLLAGSAFTFALFAAAPQILPFANFVLSGDSESMHAVGRIATGGDTWHVSLANFFNILFPFARGVGPYETWANFSRLTADPTEDFPLGFYVTGTFLLLVGLFAGLSRRVSNWHVRYAVVALTSIHLATIVLHSVTFLPVWIFEFINLGRYSTPLLSCSGAILIAFGIDAVARGWRYEARRGLTVTLVLVISVLSFFGIAMLVGVIDTNEIDWTILLHSLILCGVSLSLFALLAMLVLRNEPSRKLQVSVLLLFIADIVFQFRYGFSAGVDSLRIVLVIFIAVSAVLALKGKSWFAGVGGASCILILGWVAHAATQVYFRVNDDTYSERLARFLSGHRVATGISELLPNRGAALGVNTFSSRNPLNFMALRRIQQLTFPGVRGIVDLRGFADTDPGSSDVGYMITWKEYCQNRATFNALSIDTLVARPRDGISKPWSAYSGCAEEMDDVPNSLGLEVSRDLRAVPRAYLAPSCRSVRSRPSGKQAWQEMNARIDLAWQWPVVEALPDNSSCVGTKPASPRALKVEDVSATEVTVTGADSPAGIVVLNAAFFPGWNAYVNDSPAQVYRVNSLVRGVVVPPGDVSVRFVYRPKLLLPLALAAGGLLGIIFLAFWLRRQDAAQGHS